MPPTDVKEWLHHWQDEADAAYLYLALAGQESDAHRKDVYIKLAGVEERHVQMWSKLLAEHGHTVDQARPSVKDRKSTRLNSSHITISYAVFCLKKKKKKNKNIQIKKRKKQKKKTI